MAGDQSLEQTEIALVLHLRTAVQRLWGFETELTRYRYDPRNRAYQVLV